MSRHFKSASNTLAWPQRRRSRFAYYVKSGAVIAALMAMAVVTSVLLDITPQAEHVQEQFTICHNGGPANCVIDGDTIRHEGEKIRISDIDTPEVFSPKCDSEAALGARATQRMLQLINAGPFDLVQRDSRDEDFYGRKLRVLERDGTSLGAILVKEGLARNWDGSRHPWCV